MNLSSFLNNHRITDRNIKPTHTGMSQMMGKYHVSIDDRQQFFDLYTKSLGKGELLYLTEVHEDLGPIVIDIDMRFPIDAGFKRKYTDDDIANIVRAYHTQIRHFLKTEEKDIVAFVFEKPSPGKCLGNIKDGIHIMYPHIVCNADIQYAIRENIITSFSESKLFEKLDLKNTLDDVFDIAVVSRNNWLLYGSGKDDSPRYKLTAMYDSSVQKMKTIIKDKDLPRILSIQGKSHLAKEIKENPKSFSHKSADKKQRTTISIPTNIASSKDVDMVQKLLPLLSKERCHKYNEWIEVGFCLHNIDSSLLGVWTDWSRQSSKFKSGECELFWSRFKNDGLSIASLYRWAKIDSPDQYVHLKRDEISQVLMDSLSCTNVDVANAVYAMYKHEFICSNLKTSEWWQFSEHRWRKIDKAHTLRQNISTKLCQEYMKLNAYYKKMALDATDQNLEEFKKKIKKCDSAIKMVKTTSFKDKVIIECSELFYDPKFNLKLNSKLDLLSFENGVYDLKTDVFREGLPDDYCSFSTGVDYIPYDKTSPLVKEIMSYVDKIQPYTDERNYTLKLLGSFLNGSNGDQKFHIWTGSGANGKSTLVDLFENSLGDYCTKLNISVMCQKRQGAGTASPDLARTKGKRFVSMQEPDDGSKINVGIMKELSGGDKIPCRGLFSDIVEFKPQFKMILMCNKLPGIPSNDGGTWRRLRVLDFPSKFVDNPVNPNEYKKDSSLEEKCKSWGSAFTSIMLHYYGKYKKDGIKEPESVLQHTREYQKKSDMLLEFLEETILYSGEETDSLHVNELYPLCKAWFQDSLSDKPPSKKDFSDYLNEKYGETTSKRGLKKYKLINFEDNSILL